MRRRQPVPTISAPFLVTAKQSRADGQASDSMASPGTVVCGDDHATAPPLGFVEVSISPLSPPRTQNPTDEQATALIDTLLVSVAACQEPPLVGSVEVATSPACVGATHSDFDGHAIPLNELKFNSLVMFQELARFGLVEVKTSSLKPSPVL